LIQDIELLGIAPNVKTVHIMTVKLGKLKLYSLGEIKDQTEGDVASFNLLFHEIHSFFVRMMKESGPEFFASHNDQYHSLLRLLCWSTFYFIQASRYYPKIAFPKDSEYNEDYVAKYLSTFYLLLGQGGNYRKINAADQKACEELATKYDWTVITPASV
jgi:hypothetical protein